MLECRDAIENLVGLLPEDQPCAVEPVPAGASDSPSGYFVIDAESGVTVREAKAALHNGEDFFELLEKARNRATSEFELELRKAIDGNYGLTSFGFNGVVAKAERGTDLASAKTFGLVFSPLVKRGGFLEIKAFVLQVDLLEATEIVITKEYSGLSEEVVRVEVPANNYAGSEIKPDELLVLPFHQNGTEVTYVISMAVNDDAIVYQSRFSCCGHSPKWNSFSSFAGFDGESSIEADRNMLNVAPGINLRARATCERLDWLCEEEDLAGYQIDSVIAKAIQGRAAAWIASRAITAGNVNAVAIDYELLAERRRAGMEVFRRNIKWLAANVPEGATDCLECESAGIATVSASILA